MWFAVDRVNCKRSRPYAILYYLPVERVIHTIHPIKGNLSLFLSLLSLSSQKWTTNATLKELIAKIQAWTTYVWLCVIIYHSTIKRVIRAIYPISLFHSQKWVRKCIKPNTVVNNWHRDTECTGETQHNRKNNTRTVECSN